MWSGGVVHVGTKRDEKGQHENKEDVRKVHPERNTL
jgi:hypothetical protein